MTFIQTHKSLSQCIWIARHNCSAFPGSNHGDAAESIFGFCVDDVLIILCQATNSCSPSLSRQLQSSVFHPLVRLSLNGPFKSSLAAHFGSVVTLRSGLRQGQDQRLSRTGPGTLQDGQPHVYDMIRPECGSWAPAPRAGGTAHTAASRPIWLLLTPVRWTAVLHCRCR